MTSPNPRPNMMYTWKGHASPPMGWRYSYETMTKLDGEGRVWYPDSKEKRPRLKRYLQDTKGTILGNVWTDIDPINSRAQERLGYPTQKPLALLERIIEASSNKGDVVLDPFCGCGTAIEAAEKMDRTWIGIDITYLAVPIIRKRLKAYPEVAYAIEGAPADQESAQALADADKYQFQWWALDKIGAVPHGVVGATAKEGKKGGDQGIDGVMRFREHATEKSHRVIVSVKAGRNLNPGMVRDLCGTVNNTKATLGVFLCMGEPTKEMRKAATEAGVYSPLGQKGSFSKIQIITVKDIFEGKKVEMPGQDITELESVPEAQLSLFEQKSKRKKPQRADSNATASEIDLPSKKTSASRIARAKSGRRLAS
jgi:site-specific DNA-methyltransferase (adenine-specific)